MSKVQNYRFHCRNPKCGAEFHRRYAVTEFERNQYGTANGWGCFSCGFPRMAVMKSNRNISDGFVPGFQRNIRKVCNTYGEYKAELKKMGLVELGYEDVEHDENGIPTNYWTDDTLKMIYDHGVDLSGREIEALKSGRIDEL